VSEHRTIWYEADAATPALPEDAFALAFTLVAALDEVSLHASWRVPGHHARLYGGRVSGAIQIVAVDLRSGRAYARSAEPDHAIPLTPNPPEPGRRGGPIAASGNFSVDLIRHLGLPVEPAVYAVFLWLDELLSPVQLCEVRGPSPRAGAPFAAFGAASAAPEPRAGDVELRVAGEGLEGVAWLPGLAGEPGSLTALALFDRPHWTRWRRSSVPVNLARDEEWRFAFGLAPLLPAAGKPTKAFVVAVVEGVLSDVATVEVRA
jgi:hypothetical protein